MPLPFAPAAPKARFGSGSCGGRCSPARFCGPPLSFFSWCSWVGGYGPGFPGRGKPKHLRRQRKAPRPHWIWTTSGQDCLDENGTNYSTDLYEYTETTPYGNTVTHIILNTINVCTYYTDHGIFGEEIHFPKVSDIGNLRSLYYERTSEDADFFTDDYDLEYKEYYPSGVPLTYVVGYRWKSTEGHIIIYDERYNISDEFDVPDCKAYLDEHRLRRQDVTEEYTKMIESGEIQTLFH